MPVPSPTRSSLPRRLTGPRAALAAILICQLMVVLDVTIVNIALPDIQHALDFSPTTLSWVLNAYSLTFGGLLLLGARAGDLFGRRRVFLAGIALFTLASAAGGFTDSATLLLGARALQGVGAALASPSALALLTVTFREGAERTRAIGLYTAVSIGGSGVGLIAGGALTAWASWRWVFFVNVPIGLVLLVLAARALPETERASGRVDVPGALTSTLGMGAVVYAFVHAASDGWGDATTIGAFAVGAVLLAVFVAVETRVATPITPLRLFRDRSRNASYLARLTLVAATMGMFFFLTQFLQDVLGYSPLATGAAFLPLTVALFAGSQVSARWLAPRLAPRPVMIAGITVSAVAVGLLTLLGSSSSYATVLLPLVLLGLGNGLAFVPLTTVSLSGIAPRDAGAASGLVNVTQQVGGALGLAVLVTVFGANAHGTGPEALVRGSDAAFRVAALLLVVAVALVATIRTRRPGIPAVSTPGVAPTSDRGVDTAGAEGAPVVEPATVG